MSKNSVQDFLQQLAEAITEDDYYVDKEVLPVPATISAPSNPMQEALNLIERLIAIPDYRRNFEDKLGIKLPPRSGTVNLASYPTQSTPLDHPVFYALRFVITPELGSLIRVYARPGIRLTPSDIDQHYPQNDLLLAEMRQPEGVIRHSYDVGRPKMTAYFTADSGYLTQLVFSRPYTEPLSESILPLVDLLERLSRYLVFEKETLARDLNLHFEQRDPPYQRHYTAHPSGGTVADFKLFTNLESPLHSFIRLEMRHDEMPILEHEISETFWFGKVIYVDHIDHFHDDGSRSISPGWFTKEIGQLNGKRLGMQFKQESRVLTSVGLDNFTPDDR